MSLDDEITPKQALFVHEYLVDLNGTQAAIRAGYSKDTNSAGAQASTLLRNPKIAALIKRFMDARVARLGVTKDWVIQRLAQIAEVDMSDLAEWGGSSVKLKESTELSAAARASVQEVVETTTKEGGSLKIKQFDKLAALRLLGQELGMFTEKSEVALSVEQRPAQNLSDEELLKALDGERKDGA